MTNGSRLHAVYASISDALPANQTPRCRVDVVSLTHVSVVLTRSSNGRVSQEDSRSETSVIANTNLAYIRTRHNFSNLGSFIAILSFEIAYCVLSEVSFR
jgi:hypothetical protein